MTSEEFTLDPQLSKDTAAVADWNLSRVLLMNDRRYPWLVLMPRRAGAVEVFDLGDHDRALLWREVNAVANGLKRATQCRKINIGALGNIVSQLHVHIVARRENDAAWPGPVWGKGVAEPYGEDELRAQILEFKTLFRTPVD